MFWGKVAIFVVGDFIGNSGGTAGDYEVQHEANNFQVGKREWEGILGFYGDMNMILGDAFFNKRESHSSHMSLIYQKRM